VYEVIGAHPNGGPRPAEIIQRLILVMLNEAAGAVGEGIVRTPATAMSAPSSVSGFRPFAAARCGTPMTSARRVSWRARAARRALWRPFAPCDALRDQAQRNGKFYP